MDSFMKRLLPAAGKLMAESLSGKGPWYFGGTSGTNYYINKAHGFSIPSDDWDLRLKTKPKAPATPPPYVKALAEDIRKLVANALRKSKKRKKGFAALVDSVGEPTLKEKWGYRFEVDRPTCTVPHNSISHALVLGQNCIGPRAGVRLCNGSTLS